MHYLFLLSSSTAVGVFTNMLDSNISNKKTKNATSILSNQKFYISIIIFLFVIFYFCNIKNLK